MKFVILMYHEVADTNSLKELSKRIQHSYVLEMREFERQIKFLKHNNYKTLNLHEMLTLMQQKKDKYDERKNIVLTFDDGFAGNYEKVFPLLLENGFIGNFFLISSQIEKSNMLSWKQIQEMNKYGMCFGSHTVSHALLGTLPKDKIFNELDYSKKKIEDQISTKVEYLTLPHGSYNNDYPPAAMRAGYKGGCTSDPGINEISTDSFFLKRMNVPHGASMSYFNKLCNQDRALYSKVLMKKRLIGMVKKLIGDSSYLTLYNKFFGVDG